MARKDIGQFYSGSLVADLLVSLLRIDGMQAAIDPMVGKGDMLSALERAGVSGDRLYGVDIDSSAIAEAASQLTSGHLLTADAFSPEMAALYASRPWDLVITNPPYVRYQNIENAYGPNAGERIRKSLIGIISSFLTPDEASAYIEAVKDYSGLSDLAVPSWILCASLVRPGGTLAMVLPDAWLTREYAKTIDRLLQSEFSIEAIVEDESRTWFPDAQIKTNLLVARKRLRREPSNCDGHFRRIGLTKRAASDSSLVGALSYEGKLGAEAFDALLSSNAHYQTDDFWAMNQSTGSFLNGRSSLHAIERCATLGNWGLQVGQGLRTGANAFFYFQIDGGRVTNDLWSRSGAIEWPDSMDEPLLLALRQQSDLTGRPLVAADALDERLLFISSPLDRSSQNPLDLALWKYIEYAESHPVVIAGREKRIPSLSAVRTNGPLSTEHGKSRYWYMLPQLKARHRPDFVIPRICGGPIRTYRMPSEREVVVDANFSTLWATEPDERLLSSAFALLNSSYIRLQLEELANVLGGGALKCEAATIRKLTLPNPSSSLLLKLSKLGEMLANPRLLGFDEDLVNLVDLAVADELEPSAKPEIIVADWKNRLNFSLRRRSE